jgi:hypothetical protein
MSAILVSGKLFQLTVALQVTSSYLFSFLSCRCLKIRSMFKCDSELFCWETLGPNTSTEAISRRSLWRCPTKLLVLFVLGPLAFSPSELTWNYWFYRKSAGLIGRVINLSQDRYLCRTTQKQKKRWQTSMYPVRSELRIPVFGRAKTFHATNSAATEIGHRSSVIGCLTF